MKKYGLEFIIPELPKWRKRVWYVSKAARDKAAKNGGKKVNRDH